MKKTTILLILLFSVACFVRFYNFETRVLYGPEQGISLLSAAQNLEKPSLLGIQYLLRQTQNGLSLFTGPLFGYSLVPLMLLFNFDPIKITAFFALLNLVTGLGIYLVAKKMFDGKIAIISSALFLFSDYMIYHSLFIWTSNYMPLIGLATFYLYYLFRKEKKKLTWSFLLGLLVGVGVGIQYFYLTAALIVFVLIFKYSKNKIADLLAFVLGGALGELPTVIFDLRHNFYHLRTLYEYLLESIQHPAQSGLTYYHFLFLWPIIAILLGVAVTKITKKDALSSFLIVAIYILANLFSPRVNFNHPLGMPKNLYAADIVKSAEIINNDAPANFNVSVVGDFDNRGYSLRYPLEFMFKKMPLPVEDYPNAKSIYVLANRDYDFNVPDIWELRTFLPYKVVLVDNVNNSWGVYKLTK